MVSEEIMKLEEFIKNHYDSQADFARVQGVTRQQVTKWLNADFRVINGRLFSYRRDLK